MVTKLRRIAHISDAELVAKAEGFTVKPTLRALGSPLLKDANGNNSLQLYNTNRNNKKNSSSSSSSSNKNSNSFEERILRDRETIMDLLAFVYPTPRQVKLYNLDSIATNTNKLKIGILDLKIRSWKGLLYMKDFFFKKNKVYTEWFCGN